MTSLLEHEANIDARSEQEPKPKVLITFHGYLHDSYNLQTIPQIVNALRTHLQHSQGDMIVFEESASTSSSGKRNPKKRIESMGGLQRFISGGNLIRRLGRMPTDAEIDVYISLVDSKELPDVVQGKLIPEDRLQAYYLAQALDGLRTEWGFTYELEQHSENSHRNSARSNQDSRRLREKAGELWTQGDFTGAIRHYRTSWQFQRSSTDIRDKENTSFLKRKTKEFSLGSRGGSIFSLFGTAHYRQIVDLQRMVNQKDNPVKLQNNIDDILSSPVKSLGIRLGTPEATETDYAISFLSDVLIEMLKDTSAKGNSLPWLMRHYEDIAVRVVDFLSELSLENFKQICQKQDYDLFFRDQTFIKRVTTVLD